jgi:hypothetical protein
MNNEHADKLSLHTIEDYETVNKKDQGLTSYDEDYWLTSQCINQSCRPRFNVLRQRLKVVVTRQH